MSELPENFQEGYHAFVIGGTYKTKILPAVKIVEIIQKLNEPVILLGGPDDVERAEEIIRQQTTDNRQQTILYVFSCYYERDAEFWQHSAVVQSSDNDQSQNKLHCHKEHLR